MHPLVLKAVTPLLAEVELVAASTRHLGESIDTVAPVWHDRPPPLRVLTEACVQPRKTRFQVWNPVVRDITENQNRPDAHQGARSRVNSSSLRFDQVGANLPGRHQVLTHLRRYIEQNRHMFVVHHFSSPAASHRITVDDPLYFLGTKIRRRTAVVRRSFPGEITNLPPTVDNRL